MTIRRIETGPRMAQAVISNGHVFLAGQIGAGATTRVQAEDILKKIDHLLQQAGSGRSHLLSANIWLTDMSDFSDMNEVWDAWIDAEHPPARACVQSKLALPELKVEIAVVAQVEDKGD
ncbi:RidA family protein [Ruegeria sp. Ofav3-42]|uniref:RidA family protein n=1 Tax=Ruegeria sp. Ofav3-42 TaxID=2917759 RepID=UPI001EF3F1E3|nr:RidA family protein [Ruegeria sp. Ofav3-42]MCG7522819.1 RidA family protein [Ruegeria sp. Ofav3-42]